MIGTIGFSLITAIGIPICAAIITLAWIYVWIPPMKAGRK